MELDKGPSSSPLGNNLELAKIRGLRTKSAPSPWVSKNSLARWMSDGSPFIHIELGPAGLGTETLCYLDILNTTSEWLLVLALTFFPTSINSAPQAESALNKTTIG